MDRYDLDEQTAVRDHDAIMAATRSPRIDPPLVYKTIEDARSVDLAASRQIGDDLSPPLDDDLMEQLAEVLAQVRTDMCTEFEDAARSCDCTLAGAHCRVGRSTQPVDGAAWWR
jgi:hypothetical protein